MKVMSLVRRTELFSLEAIKPFRTGLFINLDFSETSSRLDGKVLRQ